MGLIVKDGRNVIGEPYITLAPDAVQFQNGFELAFRNQREQVLIPPGRNVGPSGLNVFPVKPTQVLDKPQTYFGELPNDILPLSESRPTYEKWGI